MLTIRYNFLLEKQLIFIINVAIYSRPIDPIRYEELSFGEKLKIHPLVALKEANNCSLSTFANFLLLYAGEGRK